MRYDCTRNVEDAIQHPHGPRAQLSPVQTGDTHPTGDRNSRLISTMSPVSPVSPVARVRDGFRNNTRRNAIGERCRCACELFGIIRCYW